MKYTNVYKEVIQSPFFLSIYIGGRGIGKTYSMLNGCRVNHKPIIYMRTSDETIKQVCTPAGNPYKAININELCDVQIKNGSSRTIISYTHDEDDHEKIVDSEILGYCYSLNTFYKMRGSEFPEVKFLYYDEFLEQERSFNKRISPSSFFQAIETIQRNRELEGGEPIRVVLTANSFSLDSDVLRYLNLVDVIRQMYNTNNKYWYDKERSIQIKILENKQVSEAKTQTALYRLTKGTSFYDLAINNDFINDVFSDIKKINYNEFYPLCRFEKITFYKHKSRDIIFASNRTAQCDNYQLVTKKKFLADYGFSLRKYHYYGQMLYNSYEVKLTVNEILR